MPSFGPVAECSIHVAVRGFAAYDCGHFCDRSILVDMVFLVSFRDKSGFLNSFLFTYTSFTSMTFLFWKYYSIPLFILLINSFLKAFRVPGTKARDIVDLVIFVFFWKIWIFIFFSSVNFIIRGINIIIVYVTWLCITWKFAVVTFGLCTHYILTPCLNTIVG